MPIGGVFDQPDFGDVGYQGKTGGAPPPPYYNPGVGPGGGSAGAGFFGLQGNIPDFGFGGGMTRRKLFGMGPGALQMRGQPSMLGQEAGGWNGFGSSAGLGVLGGAGASGGSPTAAPTSTPSAFGQFNYDPAFAYNNGQFSGGQLQTNLLTLGGRGGAYDPFGSEGLLSAIRGDLQGQYQRDLPALIQRARTQASLDSGGDPLLKAFAGTQAGIGAQNSYVSSLMDALASARQASGMQNQNFLQQLAGNFFGGAINRKDPKEQGFSVGVPGIGNLGF